MSLQLSGAQELVKCDAVPLWCRRVVIYAVEMENGEIIMCKESDIMFLQLSGV